MKLYEMTGQYLELMEMAEELEPEVFQDTLEMIQEGINDKAENIAMLLQNMQGDVDALKAEEKRLADRRRRLESHQNNLKGYLQNQMEIANTEQVKSAYFTISVRNNPPKVNILDESKVPSNYMISQEPKLDKKALKDAIKSGKQIEGVELIQERGLRIK